MVLDEERDTQSFRTYHIRGPRRLERYTTRSWRKLRSFLTTLVGPVEVGGHMEETRHGLLLSFPGVDTANSCACPWLGGLRKSYPELKLETEGHRTCW